MRVGFTRIRKTRKNRFGIHPSRKKPDPDQTFEGKPDPTFEKKPDPDTTLHKMTGSKSNSKKTWIRQKNIRSELFKNQIRQEKSLIRVRCFSTTKSGSKTLGR